MRTTTLTHCPYCSLQCGMAVEAGDRPATVQPREDWPSNRGGLCPKGWTSAELLDHPERLLTPLVRDTRDAELRPASWDEALDRVAAEFARARERYGADSVGCFGGGGLTNEKAYQLGKFVLIGLQSASIDYNGRFCMSSAAAAQNRAFGLDRGFPFPLSDIAEAEVVVLVGSNPADTLPVAMQFFDEGRSKGAVHVVVDPRETATARGSAMHLQPVSGTDLALANGLLHILIKNGWVDESYVAARTRGFEAVKLAVASYWPDRVERMTGVPVEQLRETARLLAHAGSAMILTARGAEQTSSGTETAQAWINVALALGLPGRPFSGYGTVTGQGNGQGGREHGQKADQLPGYRRIDDPEARAHVAAVWGVDPDEIPGPGRSAYEMLDGLGSDGGVRAMLVLGSNLAVSAPRANHVVQRLGELDFLAVCDFVLSETAALADVVLPVAQWAEEEGTITNVEGRVSLRRRALPPPEGVRTDLEVMAGIADRLGRGKYFATSPREIFDELRRASAGGVADYAGISYERLDSAAEGNTGVFWPCPTEDHPGTPRLFTDRFPTVDGRARFFAVQQQGPAELPDRDFPYYLTTGRVLQQYQSGAQTRRVKQLRMTEPEAFVEIHPDLARQLEIASTDLVELRSRRGRAVFRARLSEGIRPDTLFAPFHWGGESCVNALTNPVLDKFSRMPEFKSCTVAVRKLEPD